MPKELRVPRGETLGPILDLERHLPSDWWRTLFNATYLKTDGDVVENPENTVSEVDLLLEATRLERSDCVLDVCCGQGRHLLELASRGFTHLTGLDQSRYLVRLARRRAHEARTPVDFRVGDARRLRLPDASFEAVTLMGNSFGYFERVEDDLAVLREVRRVLRPHGRAAFDLVDGFWVRNHFEPRSWEWVDRNMLVCRERTLSSDGRRLVCREVIVRASKGVVVDQFYAERLYTRPEIEELLLQAGFSGVVFHGRLDAHSDRNQDLGMMERRVFLIAS